jgi:hypothetical protein
VIAFLPLAASSSVYASHVSAGHTRTHSPSLPFFFFILPSSSLLSSSASSVVSARLLDFSPSSARSWHTCGHNVHSARAHTQRHNATEQLARTVSLVATARLDRRAHFACRQGEGSARSIHATNTPRTHAKHTYAPAVDEDAELGGAGAAERGCGATAAQDERARCITRAPVHMRAPSPSPHVLAELDSLRGALPIAPTPSDLLSVCASAPLPSPVRVTGGGVKVCI